VPDSVFDICTTIQFVLAMVCEAFHSRAALPLEKLALRPAALPIDLRAVSRTIEDAIANISGGTGGGTAFPMARIE
jgi:hypothetical protein